MNGFANSVALITTRSKVELSSLSNSAFIVYAYKHCNKVSKTLAKRNKDINWKMKTTFNVGVARSKVE